MMSPLSSLMKAFAGQQSRALVLGRHTCHKFAKVKPVKELKVEVAPLKQQFSTVTSKKGTLSLEMGKLFT